MESKWNAKSEIQEVERYGYKGGAGYDKVLVRLAMVTQWFSNGKTEQAVQSKGFFCV